MSILAALFSVIRLKLTLGYIKGYNIIIFTDRTYVYGPIIVPVVGIIQASNTNHRA